MSAARPKLLIGEHDPFMRRTLERTLGADYELIFAENGEELVNLAQNHFPDIILLEALLPGMDGFKACHHIKSHDHLKSIPILFHTFLNAEERARQAGADAFLLKPADMKKLKATIQQLLSRATKGDE
ncbi:MAG: response regulator [Anaerolineales bacterium]